MTDMAPADRGVQKQTKLMDAKSAHAIFELREREFRKKYYLLEKRWKEETFWKRRHG